jgi:hypothetical protein
VGIYNSTPWGAWIQAQDSRSSFAGTYPLVLNPAGGNVGIGTVNPQYKLDVNGIVNSGSGGFRFPDGTVQTTAASAGGGSQTPWLSNIDGGGFYLSNVNAVHVAGGSSLYNDRLEVGQYGSGDRWAYVDFHSSGGPATLDFSARVGREPGVGGDMTFEQTGSGWIRFIMPASPAPRAVAWMTSNESAITVSSPTTGLSWGNAALQIRESQQAGGVTDPNYTPRIAFHWSGRVACSFGLETSGAEEIRTFNNPGTGYVPFRAQYVYAVADVVAGANCQAATFNGLSIQGPGGATPSGNQILRTDVNGWSYFTWINTVSGDNGTTAISRIYASNDAFVRYYTPANFGAQIGQYIANSGGTNTFGQIELQHFAPLIDFKTSGSVDFDCRILESAGPGLLFYVGGSAAAKIGLDIQASGRLACPNMPTTNPGAGTKVLWADPADGYRVKLAN